MAIYCLFPEYQENSCFAYDEEQAVIESFARGLKHSREGQNTLDRGRARRAATGLSRCMDREKQVESAPAQSASPVECYCGKS